MQDLENFFGVNNFGGAIVIALIAALIIAFAPRIFRRLILNLNKPFFIISTRIVNEKTFIIKDDNVVKQERFRIKVVNLNKHF